MLKKIFQSFRSLRAIQGASTLEVAIMNTAIISLLIVFLTLGGPFQETVSEILFSVSWQMESISLKLNPNSTVGSISYSTWKGNKGGWSSIKGDLENQGRSPGSPSGTGGGGTGGGGPAN